MNKTILFVGNTAWSMYNFRLNVMLSFRQQGFRVVVSAPPDDYAHKLTNKGIEFVPLLKLNNKGTNLFGDLNFFRELISVYKTVKPDFVFHYTVKPNIYGSMTCWLLKIPSIAITTGLGYAFAEKNLIASIVIQLYKFSLKHAKEVWFLNQDDRDTFVNRKIIAEPKAYLLNSEGVDTVHFSPMSKINSSHKTIFLFSARLIIDKGIKEFINAVILLRNQGFEVEGHIVGFLDVKNPNGITKDDLDSFINKNDCIIYKGSTSDIRQFIREADCVVLPSFYREGVPRILMEGAAMGKPLITTQNVGCRETVSNNITGFLCNSKDTNDLADKMKSFILLSDKQRDEMGNMGRNKMLKEFDEKLIIDTYQNKLKSYIL